MKPVQNDQRVEPLLPAGWPRPRGYSHGVVARGRLVFIAGQVGWNPLTETFDHLAFSEQVRQTLLNIVSVLSEAGAAPQHLVRLTWFIADPDGYSEALEKIGEIYSEIMGRHYPVMSVVIVDKLLEEGAKVEIEATAVIPD